MKTDSGTSWTVGRHHLWNVAAPFGPLLVGCPFAASMEHWPSSHPMTQLPGFVPSMGDWRSAWQQRGDLRQGCDNCSWHGSPQSAGLSAMPDEDVSPSQLFTAAVMPGMPSDLRSGQDRHCRHLLIPSRKVPVLYSKCAVGTG